MVPYIFAYNPVMILEGVTSFWEVLFIGITALLGIFCVAAALNGHLYQKIPAVLRVVMLAAGLCMMIPGWETDLIGLVLMVAVIFVQYMKNKKLTTAAGA